MPNPRSGTVALDIGRVVREIKAGKVEFRVIVRHCACRDW